MIHKRATGPYKTSGLTRRLFIQNIFAYFFSILIHPLLVTCVRNLTCVLLIVCSSVRGVCIIVMLSNSFMTCNYDGQASLDSSGGESESRRL